MTLIDLKSHQSLKPIRRLGPKLGLGGRRRGIVSGHPIISGGGGSPATIGSVGAGGVGGSSAFCAVPAGVAIGSLVAIAAGCEWNSSTTPTTASCTSTGFTCAAVFTQSSNESAFLLWKYATAADTGFYDVNFSSGGVGCDESGALGVRIAGGPTSGNPFVDTFHSAGGGSGSATVSSFTPGGPNSLFLAAVWCDDGAIGTIPSGWTKNTQGGGSGYDVGLMTLAQTSATATGSLVFNGVDDMAVLIGTIR